MTLYEILDEMGYLCDTHDIIFEINEWGLYIRKDFYYDGKPCNFNQSFSFEILKYRDLDNCVLEFEKALEKELSKKKGDEWCILY